MTASPGRTRSGPSSRSASTTPVAAPARSKSSGPRWPGCSAVSPPISAQPARTHPSRDAAHDRRDPFRPNLAAHDVVGQEQRLRPADHEIVDDHADEVDADRVVDAEPLRDHHLRAHAVGGTGQQRPPVTGEPGGVEQPGEAADTAHDLGPGGAGDGGPDQVNSALPGRDVDPRPRVAQAVVRHAGGVHAAVAAGSRRHRVLEQVLSLLGGGDVQRVGAVEAGTAQPRRGQRGRGDQALQRHVAERVSADRHPDLLGRQAARDQLGPAREVDAVEARPGHGRAGDADVHLGRARLAQHGHDRPLRVAADDRVVDDDDPLARDDVPERVQLQPDAALPDRLARLDEGPADIGVLDQSLPVRDAAGLGVADGGRGAGLRHRDDQVGLRRVLGGEPPADLDPGRLDAPAGYGRVRAGQVHVLEQASPRLRPGRRCGTAHPARRWRSAPLARPRARTTPRRCPAPRSRWRPPSRARAARARAGGSPAGHAPRTGSARP